MEPKESRQSPPEATNTLSSQNETGKSSGSDIRSVDQNQNPEADNKIVASEPKTKTDVESVPHVRWLINDGEWREMTKSEIQNARQANGQSFSTHSTCLNLHQICRRSRVLTLQTRYLTADTAHSLSS